MRLAEVMRGAAEEVAVEGEAAEGVNRDSPLSSPPNTRPTGSRGSKYLIIFIICMCSHKLLKSNMYKQKHRVQVNTRNSQNTGNMQLNSCCPEGTSV